MLGDDPTSPSYHAAYAVNQFMSKVREGLRVDSIPPLWGKEVLEIGCGHGGISIYLASLGAKRVVGIDLESDRLAYAAQLRERVERESGRKLAVEFLEMDAMAMSFPDASFDIMFADNFLEHVADVRRFFEQAHRILKPGGLLVAPVFASILSKWGLHLKHGLRIPWANLLFSEPAIISALKRQAERRPELLEIYPGLRRDPTKVRDLRLHRDLNGVTNHQLRAIATSSGFEIVHFRVHATETGRIVRRLVPTLTETRLVEILSTGAALVLRRGALP